MGLWILLLQVSRRQYVKNSYLENYLTSLNFMKALIGASGLLGHYLTPSQPFDYIITPQNIEKIRTKQFTEIVCVISDSNEVSAFNEDKDNLRFDNLINVLSEVKTDRFTLISHVDVLEKTSFPCLETSPYYTEETAPDSFISNRIRFEEFINLRFGRVVTIRLPQMFCRDFCDGIMRDIKGKNSLKEYSAMSLHRYYPLSLLLKDIEHAWSLGLSSLNLAPEPFTAEELVQIIEPTLIDSLNMSLPKTKISPLVHSLHAIHWLDTKGFLYNKETILKLIAKEVVSS